MAIEAADGGDGAALDLDHGDAQGGGVQHQLIERGAALGDHQQTLGLAASSEGLLHRPAAGHDLFFLTEDLGWRRTTRWGRRSETVASLEVAAAPRTSVAVPLATGRTRASAAIALAVVHTAFVPGASLGRTALWRPTVTARAVTGSGTRAAASGPVAVGLAAVRPVASGPIAVGLAAVWPVASGPVAVGPATLGLAAVWLAAAGPASTGLAAIRSTATGLGAIRLATTGLAAVGLAAAGSAVIGLALVGLAVGWLVAVWSTILRACLFVGSLLFVGHL